MKILTKQTKKNGNIKVKLFGIFTLLSIKRDGCKKVYKLFNLIPLYKINIFNISEAQKNYETLINKLQLKKQITVGFLVWENQKWSYDYLYELFSKSDRFIPIVLVVNMAFENNNIETNTIFFKNKGYATQVINSVEDLKKLGIDVIFYEQTWATMFNEFFPVNLSKNFLCFYVPYSVELDANKDILKEDDAFFQSCYKTFVFCPQVAERMKKYGIANTIVAGHSRLDEYLKPQHDSQIWKTKNKFRIIYAPHHSFSKSILKWATYGWSGEYIRQLAIKYKDTTEWIFKPHPRFYLELINEFGKDYADKVFADWGKVATIYDYGNYFDIFRNADLMISDCGSFKIEWLPTGKPYIHLQSQYKDAHPLSSIDAHYSSSYYFASNLDDIEKYFTMIVERKEDPKKELRTKLIAEIPMNASQKIYDYVCKLLTSENESHD